ncbi:RibD family protein [Nocardioides sp. NPDC059952]|uniref:RibD family protein n=1 Tax=Nocardioides sp. NPDC059952 TaxID=3347014 RepID=UPI00365C4448
MHDTRRVHSPHRAHNARDWNPALSRPYVLLSVAASLDGYIDDASPDRLLLSNDEDFDRVDDVRASVDAILVGANTIRADNPRLMVRSDERRDKRVADGKAATPIKVTITNAGDLDADAKFFATGDVGKIVYTTDSSSAGLAERLVDVATVVGVGPTVNAGAILDDLGSRGVERLMVEGGGTVHTMFLTSGLVDEVHLVFAPFLVGDTSAPRFVNAGAFPQDPSHRMRLAETRQIGDCVLLRYLPR